MSGMIDGVSKVWTVHIGPHGSSLDIHGYGSNEDAALQLFMLGAWRPDVDLRAKAEAFKKRLDERVERELHEHEWVAVGEGDMACKRCTTCGAIYEGDDE